MIYIHALKDLNPKTIEIESTELIRELKQKIKLPFSEQKIKEYLTPLFISNTDIEVIESAIQELMPATDKIIKVFLKKDPVNEPVNLGRAAQMLREMQDPLQKNMEYIKEMELMQGYLSTQITEILNTVPKLATREEKIQYNEKIKKIFRILLRNEHMAYNAAEIINEAQTKRIKDLSESLTKGYLFHFTLEDELRKATFDEVRPRIKKESLDESEEILKSVQKIKKGIDRAYDSNMRMLSWAVTLYAYLKWITQPKIIV